MKENKYDDPEFFGLYSAMLRSRKGLEGAGEWHVLKGMLPDLAGKKVLDLGCGFGWHCRYAAEHGALSVTGVDISGRMVERALEINRLDGIQYIVSPIEEAEFPDREFDVVISSLTLHYIENFEEVVSRIYRWLKPEGYFVFSVEHPVFTAFGSQEWFYGENGEKLCWPVDRYFSEGAREALFLGQEVVKYHRTLTTYLGGLVRRGFTITNVAEPEPSERMLQEAPEMSDELRRPMMLLAAARK